MSTEEKYEIKGTLSDLLATAKELNELDLVVLRDEIKKEIEAGDKTLEKFLELVESFKEDLPKEKQWYRVAIRALFTTSKISKQNVIESIDKQLEELGKIENSASSGLTGFSDELSEMEARLLETKSELTELHEKIAALEKEEREILGKIVEQEKEKKAVEEAVKKVFTDLTEEISTIKNKIEEYTAEKASTKPTAEPGSVETQKQEEVQESGAEEEKREAPEEVTIPEPPPTQDTEFTKKCPMCRGQINFLIQDAKWMCYTCGYEEEEKKEA